MAVISGIPKVRLFLSFLIGSFWHSQSNVRLIKLYFAHLDVCFYISFYFFFKMYPVKLYGHYTEYE